MGTTEERVSHLEAKVGDHATVTGELKSLIVGLDQKIDRRFDAFDQQLDRRFETIDRRFEAIDRRFDGFDQRVEKRFEGMERRFEEVGRRFDQVDGRFSWVIGIQFTALLAMMAAMFGVITKLL